MPSAAAAADQPAAPAVLAAARELERGRYLAALLARRDARGDLLAIAAYCGETGRIPLLVSDPMIGEIRLQWWRDALPALTAGETTGHPVADALGAAIRRHALPVGLLSGMLEARAFELYADPMPDEAAFKAYLARTEGAAVELALRALQSWPPGAAAGAAISAGQALGIARALTGLPHMLARGRCVLPATRLAAAGIEVADLAAQPLPAPARALLLALAQEARGELSRIAAAWPRISRRARPALLPVALVAPSLDALLGRGHHPGRDLASVMPITQVWRIWRAQMLDRL